MKSIKTLKPKQPMQPGNAEPELRAAIDHTQENIIWSKSEIKSYTMTLTSLKCLLRVDQVKLRKLKAQLKALAK